jgi:hypothetical protein
MQFRIELVTVADDGTEQRQELVTLTRNEAKPETIGLALAESKQLLQALQQAVVEQQVDGYLDQERACPHCGKKRRLKQGERAPFRTLFGLVEVSNPRWRQCNCQPHTIKTLRPLAALLPERTSPELLYLETKWASLAAYGLTTELLHEVLPIDQKHSAITVRNHTLRMARRKEQMLGDEHDFYYMEGSPEELSRLPIPDGPLSVGLDGGIVRARRGKNGEQSGNLFEVIAGKSILSFRRDDPEEAPVTSKCFALVRSVDKKPKRRLFELLQAQGLQANQRVTFFSDGGDTVRQLPAFLHPSAEHILDWFHCTMRITVLQQCARGLAQRWAAHVAHNPEEESLERRLESVKHYLWHGSTVKVLEQLRRLEEDLAGWDYDGEGEPKPQVGSAEAVRMLKYVRELQTYLSNNAQYIVNYGERYRNGEWISTSFAESTINQVISKRMVKKQQMQWTPEGAHLLLQVRTAVLNEDWEDTFRTWYPQFRPVPISAGKAA